MKRNLFIGFLLVGLSLSLGACNNSTPQESSSTPDTSSAETTSSVEASSSKEDPSAFNIQKIKQNIAAMNNYKIVLSSVLNAEGESGGVPYIIDMTGSYTFEVDKKNFSSIEKSAYEQTYPLSKMAEMYSMTVADFIEYMKNYPYVEIDQENDKFISKTNNDYGPFIYRYDETSKQHIKYTLYDNKVVDGTYVTYGGDSVIINAYRSLISKVLDQGTIDAENNKIVFQITDEYRSSVEYGIITDNGDYFSSFTLVVNANQPSKLIFGIDNERVEKRYGKNVVKTFTMEMAFSDIGTVELTVPTDDVACAHHEKEGRYEDDYHYYCCGECGIILGEKEAHDFDETHNICKVCGKIKGISGESYSFIKDVKKYSEPIGEDGLYAFSYLESAKGDKYSLRPFYDPERDNNEYNSYNGIYYNVELGAAVVEDVGETSYLADGSCVEYQENTYKLYKGLTIEDNSEPMIGDKTIDEYFEEYTGEPDATIKASSINLSHINNDGKVEDIDSCHKTRTYTCSRCHEVTIISQNIAHQEIVFTINGEMQFDPWFVSKFGTSYRYSTFDNNKHYFDAHCAACSTETDRHDLYVVIDKSIGEMHSEYKGANVDIYEKEGSRTVYSYVSGEIPHIADNDNKCALCGEQIYGITNTDVQLGVKLSTDGSYITHFDFLLDYLSDGQYFYYFYNVSEGDLEEQTNAYHQLVSVDHESDPERSFSYDVYFDKEDMEKVIGLVVRRGSHVEYEFPASA